MKLRKLIPEEEMSDSGPFHLTEVKCTGHLQLREDLRSRKQETEWGKGSGAGAGGSHSESTGSPKEGQVVHLPVRLSQAWQDTM